MERSPLKEISVHLAVAVLIGVLAYLHEVQVVTGTEAFQVMLLLWILQAAVVCWWALSKLRGHSEGVGLQLRTLNRKADSAGDKLSSLLSSVGYLAAEAQLPEFPPIIRAAIAESSVHGKLAFRMREMLISEYMLTALWYRQFWVKLVEAQDRLLKEGKRLIVRVTQNANVAGSSRGPWGGEGGDRLVGIQGLMARKGGRILRLFVGDPGTGAETLARLQKHMDSEGIMTFRCPDDGGSPRGDFMWLHLAGVDDEEMGKQDIVVRWLYSGDYVVNSSVTIGNSDEVARLWNQLTNEVLKQPEINAEQRRLLTSEAGFESSPNRRLQRAARGDD